MFKEDKFIEFLTKFKIVPNDLKFYEQAFMHSSYVKNKSNLKSYEELEFLGDSILQFTVSFFLFTKYRKLKEGKLTLLRSRMVNTTNLNKISEEWNLKEFLVTGKGQMHQQVLQSDKVGADIYEALVAAIFLDQRKMQTVQDFLALTLFPSANYYLKENSLKDPKTQLQEYMQSLSKKAVIYETERDNNEPTLFIAKAIHEGNIYGVGSGSSKAIAEENAAQDALDKMSL